MKTILVIGATGHQGGSVVRYLLNDGSFKIKALVRNSNSLDKVKIQFPTVECVMGDLNSTDSLANAMQGCYGVFGVTNFWDHSVGYEGEIQHSKNIGDACKMAGVQHLVFSTLDRNSGVPHFESKVIGEDYIRSIGVPMTTLVTSFYFENFLTFFQPKVNESGELCMSVAQKSTTNVPMFSVYDTGLWVLEAFKNPQQYIGKDIAAVSEYLNYQQVVKIFADISGKKCNFVEIPLNVFRGFGFPGVEELAANLEFFDDISDGRKHDRRKVGMTQLKGENLQQFLKRAQPSFLA
jgi:uncharacterized protein YbjT (DUF2867 family)